jgi:hypothetical protein
LGLGDHRWRAGCCFAIVRFWIVPKVLKYDEPVVAADNRFRQEFNAEAYVPICNGVDPAFQDPAQRGRLIDLFRALSAAIGKPVVAKAKGITFETTNSGSFVVTKYKLIAEKASADETIIWKRESGGLRLWAYKVDSSVFSASWGSSMWPNRASP